MARAALPVGLGIIGGLLAWYTGGASVAAGFAIGAAIGSVIAAIAFPPDTPDVNNVGPRLDEQRFMKSSHGIPIPRAFGTYRLAANIIWSNGIEEVKTVTKEGGGKGGGGGELKTTTFTYYTSFAAAFAQSGTGQTPKLRKLYMDNKLWLDFTGTGKPERCDIEWRFYDGSASQEPDPLMEAEEGLGNVSAHRGLVYLMVDRLAVKNFGNRIPQIHAEITFDGAANGVEAVDTATLTATLNSTQWATDFRHNRLYFYADDNPSPTYLDEWNTETGLLEAQATISVNLDDQQGKSLAILPSGDRQGMMLAAASSTVNPLLYLINPRTGEVLDQTEITGSSTHIQYVTWIKSWVLTEDIGDGGGTGVGRIQRAYKTWAVTYQGAADKTVRARSVKPMEVNTAAVGFGFGDDVMFDSDDIGSPAALICWSHARIDEDQIVMLLSGFSGGAGRLSYLVFFKTNEFSETSAVKNKLPFKYPPMATQWLLLTDATDVTDIIYLRDEHAIVGVTYNTSSDTNFGDGGEGMAKWALSGNRPGEYSITLQQVIDRRSNPEFSSGNLVPTPGLHTNMIRHETWWAYPKQSYLYMHNQSGGTIDRLKVTGRMRYEKGFYDLSIYSNFAGMVNGIYNPLLNAFHFANASLTTPDNRQVVYLDRVLLGTTPLDEVVSQISADVGVGASDLDVTDLNSESITGIAFAQQIKARGAIGTLALLHNFDGVESDFQILFKFKGAAAVRTLTQDDYGAQLDSPATQPITESRVDEDSLPQRLDLTYIDADDDFQPANQATQAPQTPTTDKVNFSDAIKQIETAEVFLAAEAKERCEKIFYRAWAERAGFEFTALPKHLDLDPTDVLLLSLSHGLGTRIERVRIVDATLGGPMTVELKTLQDDDGVFNLTNTDGASSLGVPIKNIPFESQFDFFPIDTPYLRDSDFSTSGETGVYTALASTNPANFSSGLVFMSPDNSSYVQWLFSTRQVDWGYSTTALADTASWASKDTVNTVTVNPVGTFVPTSATEAQVLEGANAALLGDEILQFETVVDNMDGTYTLSNLYRARRGTSYALDTHVSGEVLIMVSPADIERRDLTLALIGQTVFYKPLAFGASFDEVDTLSITYVGRDVTPLEPVAVEGERDGSSNLIVRWIRQSRERGTSDIDADTRLSVPVGEASGERYEAALMTPGGAEGTIVTNGSDVAVDTITDEMDITDNLDGTATIVATTEVFTPLQVFQWIRFDNWANADNNTHAVIQSISGSTMVVRLQDATNETNRANVSIVSMPSFAVFSSAEQTGAGWDVTKAVNVTVYQLNDIVGRGFPGNEDVPEGLPLGP